MAITQGMKQTSIKLVDAIEEYEREGYEFKKYVGHGKYWFKVPERLGRTVIDGDNMYLSISNLRFFAYGKAMRRQGLK